MNVVAEPHRTSDIGHDVSGNASLLLLRVVARYKGWLREGMCAVTCLNTSQVVRY